MPTPTALISALALHPHPEGGHFREVWRSPERVQTARGERSALTLIHYLLAAGQRSRWHVVQADEVWTWLGGEPLELLMASPAAGSTIQRSVLGATDAGHAGMAVVPAGHAQAARPLGAHALVACTVGPGFDFADFALCADLPAWAARLRASAADLL